MKIRLMLLVISFNALNHINGQDFKKWEEKRLTNFGINLNNYDLDNFKINTDFQNILHFEKKRRTNKTVAIIFSTMSLTLVGIGIHTININKGSGIGEGIGTVVTSIGVLWGGLSIPFHIGTRKRKKERDKLLLKY